MTSKEKIFHLKGLIKGMDLDQEKKETKIFNEIMDILESLASEVEENQCDIENIYEEFDEFDADLSDIEKKVFGINDCECGCNCDCHEKNCCEENEDFYEVVCPKCNEQICFSENFLANEIIKCPNCSEILEFDFKNKDKNGCCGDTCECEFNETNK